MIIRGTHSFRKDIELTGCFLFLVRGALERGAAAARGAPAPCPAEEGYHGREVKHSCDMMCLPDCAPLTASSAGSSTLNAAPRESSQADAIVW